MAEPIYDFRPAGLADLPLLRQWLATPDVGEWWGADDPYDASDLDDPRFLPSIVQLDSAAFA
jgi:aminoglycoside 6'-N-acetyltransferase